MKPVPALVLNFAVAVILAGFFIALVYTVPARAGGPICGEASYYGSAHHGKRMANGQPFNMRAMTAAMWDVPFGTKFRVTHEGRSVVVTITDRGPARRLNRIIDLSRAAAAKLGMIHAGTGRVCVERL